MNTLSEIPNSREMPYKHILHLHSFTKYDGNKYEILNLYSNWFNCMYEEHDDTYRNSI